MPVNQQEQNIEGESSSTGSCDSSRISKSDLINGRAQSDVSKT